MSSENQFATLTLGAHRQPFLMCGMIERLFLYGSVVVSNRMKMTMYSVTDQH